MPAAGQALMLRDGLATDGRLFAYDDARQRLVAVGRHGETRELDGSQWLLRPGTGPTMLGALAYRRASKRMLAFGKGFDLTAQTWEHDGVAWRQLAPAVQPSARQRFAVAWDSLRDRVVVFSGLGTTVGDTWEWDGTNWQQRATTGPLARQDSSMAYDAARGCCVLFGGQATGGAQGDTWEWNGTAWTQRTFATAPSPRVGPALAYDPGRSRVVLYGGLLPASGTVSNEVWEYDGVAWQSVGFTGGSPGGRYRHDLVFDSRTNEVLVVGGLASGSGATDVWSWNGTRWQPVVAVPYQPAWAYGARAVGDPVSGSLLLYGGATYLLAGSTWSYVAGAPPVPRQLVAMWSDGTRAWLFGGRDIFGPLFGDTWSWNGAAWLPAAPAASPAPRAGAAVAYDVFGNRAVLFGGTGAALFADTWTFDGTNWQVATPAGSPPARAFHAMAFDLLRGRTVLFGGAGAGSTMLRDTWEWNGTTWSAVATAVQPPGHGTASMAYDVVQRKTVMVTAPWSGSLLPRALEAWTFDGSTWAPLPLAEPRMLAQYHSLAAMPTTGTLFLSDGSSAQELVHVDPRADVLGAPCDPQAPLLVARAWPEPGNGSFGLDVVRAPPLGAFLLGGALSAAAVPIGTCTLQLGPPVTTIVGVPNAGGFASQPIPVPPLAGLIGTQLWFQAAVLQPLSASGVTLSPALRVRIGE